MSAFHAVLSLTLFSYMPTAVAENTPIITTVNGPIVGRYMDNIAVFFGVPYAQPPVGSLRFQKPLDPLNWTDVQLCNESYHLPCFAAWADPQNMTEDCLHLNIFTPSLDRNAKLPVMLYIHGGGFFGQSSFSDFTFADEGESVARNIPNRGVVFVSIDYRLMSFGLFTTTTCDFPANVALFDQAKALEWVQKNIANFGGDPEKVTIFGESSGGWCVTFLSYSPVTQGYFQQVIAQSGTALSPHAMMEYRTKYDPSMDFAVALNCVTAADWAAKKFTDMKNCLTQKSAMEIYNVTIKMGMYAKDDPLRVAWVPQIDGPGGFFPSSLSQLAPQRNPKTRVMIGSTRDDGGGLDLCLTIDSCIETLNGYTQTNIDNMTTSISMIYGSTTSDVKNILDFVYNNGLTATAPADHKGWVDKFGDLLGGYLVHAGARKEMLAWQSINVDAAYMFSFDYVAAACYPWRTVYPAAPHGSDLMFLFNQTDWLPADFTPSATDISVADLMGIMWTNFAISGDPNRPVSTGQPQWLPSSAANAEFYSINATSTMQTDYHHTAHHMWDELIPEITAPTVPTTTAPSTTTGCPTSATLTTCPAATCVTPTNVATGMLRVHTVLLLTCNLVGYAVLVL